MSRRTLGIGLILGGLLVAAASLLADYLGLGAHPGVLGWKQILGAVVGGAAVLAGVALLLRYAGPAANATQALRGDGDGLAPREPDGVALFRAPKPSHETDVPVYDSNAVRVPFIHELTELYRYRYLMWNLISRDLKVRYKRSVLGFLWAMINPLLTMAVLLVVFMQLFRLEVDNYPVYILAGLLLWNLFARGTTVAMHAVLDNSGMRRQIYVPASVFVAGAVGSAVVNLLFALVPLLILAVAGGVTPRLTWLYLPVPILQMTLLTFGVGVILAALAVFFADMLDIYEVVLNAFFYLTPIIYPMSILPPLLSQLQLFNPANYLIDAFRLPLIYGVLPSLTSVVTSTAMVLALTVAGWSLFTRLSDQFAYRV
jgi:ABC-type polysaccharide/polyol phosphate export permease